jgi:Ser/Thr protein kinase RdoA (MazF antagonist)
VSDHNAVAWVATDQGALVVKWSCEARLFDRLSASTVLLRRLADRGVPVAAPLPTVAGHERAVLDGPTRPLSVAVLPELDGDWLDVGDHAAVRAAGACLARVHAALAQVDDGVLAAGAVEAPHERTTRWLDVHDHGLAPDATSRLRALHAAAPLLDDPAQLVHNDFRAANVLVRDRTVIGVLDLDDVAHGHRVDDLAKACTYLGTLFRGWGPTSRAAQDALRAGYESVRPLEASEAAWFEVLLLLHGLDAVPGPDDPTGWAAALAPSTP